MLIALLAMLLLSGSTTSAGVEFVDRLAKVVGKKVADPAARTAAESAVGEMKVAFEQYGAEIKRTLVEAASTNASYTMSAADFEHSFQHLDRTRAEAMERLVAARAKLRQAITPDQWDATIGAAAKP
jgi:histone H3/H4